MTYLIIVPIYKELPHIEGNINSLNDWEHLFIIDNSKTGWCKKFEEKGATVIYRPENIGVARSWNEGIKQGKDYNFFVSSSVYWPKGFKELSDHLENLIAEGAKGIEYGLFCNLGWHANAISQKTVEICGFMDENFYPAYYEDTDYCRRLYLAGLHPNQYGETLGGTIPGVVISASPIEIAVTIKHAGLPVNFLTLGDYYKRKWNGNKPDEKFNKPFGDKELGYFPEKSIEQLRIEYGI